MTTTLKFYYNGIKVNNGNLLKGFYSLNNDASAVTFYADHDDLPRDVFPVENNTDYYTDYFEDDRFTISADHPLFRFAKSAAIVAHRKSNARSVTHYEKMRDRHAVGSQYWKMFDRYANEARAKMDLFGIVEKIEQPTEKDLEAVREMNIAAENARKARELAEEQERREKHLAELNENKNFIIETVNAHPFNDPQNYVVIKWSELPGLADDENLPLSIAAAEIILKHFDEKEAAKECGYAKTSFIIHFIDENGNADTYEGRYDLGDNDGGLVAHVESWLKETKQDTTPTGEKLVKTLYKGANVQKIVSVSLMPGIAELIEKRRNAQQIQTVEAVETVEEDTDGDNIDDLDAGDIFELVEMLTDEQLIAAVMRTNPGDKTGVDVARFFLQELAKRDRKKAIQTFAQWKKKGGAA